MTKSVAPLEMEESVSAWRAALLSGKSEAVSKFVKSPSEADAAGIMAGARVLAREEGTLCNGIAVAVYALTTSGAVKAKSVALEIGLSEGRISQLKLQGEVIARYGLPEGWRTPITTLQLQQIVGGKLGSAAKLREFVESGGKVDTVRRAISAHVESSLADREERQSQITAARKEAASKARAAREGKLGTNPTAKAEGVDAPAPVEVTPETLGQTITQHLATLREVSHWLAGHVTDMTEAQRVMARESIMPLGIALHAAKSAPEVKGVVVSDAPKPSARKRPARKTA